MSRGVIERYRQFLPITEKTPMITLGEGSTPLIPADRLAREIGYRGDLLLKWEGVNPTGSFKDRGMVVAVAKAMEDGAEILMCASTGNTASSAAAYGAATGLKTVVLVPEGGVAQGKLGQMRAYGAEVVTIQSGFDACQSLVRELKEKYPKQIALVNSVNPYRLQGQKTAAFEICDKLLGRGEKRWLKAKRVFPDYLFIPVGNAGNIAAYWIGFREYQEEQILLYIAKNYDKAEARKKILAIPHIAEYLKLPKTMGYQAAGAAPIVHGHAIKNPKTVASAIRVGNPAGWQNALKARDESGGKIDSVTDSEILAAYEIIPRLTGIFCEPASASAVAGLQKAIRNGDIENTEDKIAVCVLTGNGLKDQETAGKQFARTAEKSIGPVLKEVEKELGL